jgi:hypothetical protein
MALERVISLLSQIRQRSDADVDGLIEGIEMELQFGAAGTRRRRLSR